MQHLRALEDQSVYILREAYKHFDHLAMLWSFVSQGSLWASRSSQCAVRLSNGNPFIGGGLASAGTWEIRDGNGGFISNGSFWASRDLSFTCSLFLNGNVFVAGGTANLGNWEIRNARSLSE
ncbi:MAG: hypothetical protein Q8N04_11285 [Nitrospira sp.]|nr:hypothetical protein [Nitrospira sp.]